MGLRINTNIASVNAQRNLQNTSRILGRSLERLSSGSRINRAGDDAAGLAISEGLNSQVRGLKQAVRNANDSLGFLNTAEGALSEVTNITQRLRELAIQAANGAIGNRERGFLNEEVKALLAEFNRIANQTEFNGTKLLDGTFVETDLQVGVNKGDSIGFTIGDARTSALGALAVISGFQNNITSTGSSIQIGVGDSNATINLDATIDQLSPSAVRSYSAITVTAAINQAAGTTGVQATNLGTQVQLNDLTFSSNKVALADGDFKINGTSIVGSVANVSDFISTVNNFSSATGVKAALKSGSTDDVVLTAADGRTVQLFIASSGTVTSAQGFDTIDIFATSFSVGGNYQAAASPSMQNLLFVSTMSAALDGFVNSSAAFSAATFTFTGAIELRSADAILIQGSASAAFGFSTKTAAVRTDNAINTIAVGTQDDAQEALATIDATLGQLNSLRANLGAVQNRLESTIRNLSIGLENISSAQSQIRDADVAAETAELTRGQILQQAGVAVLGQANTSAQVALSLLRF